LKDTSGKQGAASMTAGGFSDPEGAINILLDQPALSLQATKPLQAAASCTGLKMVLLWLLN
jgi:hypothetical protein